MQDLIKKYEQQLETVRGQKTQLDAQMQQIEQNFIKLTAIENQLLGALMALGQLKNDQPVTNLDLPTADVQ